MTYRFNLTVGLFLHERRVVSYLEDALALLARLQLSLCLVVVLLQSFSPADTPSTPHLPLMMCRDLAARAILRIGLHCSRLVCSGHNVSFEGNSVVVDTTWLICMFI